MVNQPGKMLSLLTKADVELAAGKSRDLALEHYFSAREIAELRGFLPAKQFADTGIERASAVDAISSLNVTPDCFHDAV